MANMKIDEIEGVGPTYAAKLRGIGIESTSVLLERGASPDGRQEISETAKIPARRLLGWINMADLFRVDGVGPEFAELLVAAGVDTVKELATRNPDNLAASCAEVNEERRLARRSPSAVVVARWIAEARDLPQIIRH